MNTKNIKVSSSAHQLVRDCKKFGFAGVTPVEAEFALGAHHPQVAAEQAAKNYPIFTPAAGDRQWFIILAALPGVRRAAKRATRQADDAARRGRQLERVATQPKGRIESAPAAKGGKKRK